MTFKPNEQIYKYELLKKIGGGNFGEVWLANDNTLKTSCALKLLPQNTVSIDERLLEAQIGNRLQHSNVVNIKYADIVQYENLSDPIVVIAMPFYKNGSIVTQVNSCNFIRTDLALKCVIDILRGLEYLHENGYYHCDIKPNNILVGDNGEYILSDYGITCYSPSHSVVHPKQCYLPHISPETLQQNLYNSQTDIYQLGLTAFRIFNGISEIKSSFIGDGEAFAKSVVEGTIVTDSKYQPYVPKKIRKIISKAISVEPEKRFKTALDMRRALEQVYLKGYCTSNNKGDIEIVMGHITYRYEVIPVSDRLFNINVYQKNQRSGRETKARKYCAKGIKQPDLKKTLEKMINAMI